jgi:hypothetical protein
MARKLKLWQRRQLVAKVAAFGLLTIGKTGNLSRRGLFGACFDLAIAAGVERVSLFLQDCGSKCDLALSL